MKKSFLTLLLLTACTSLFAQYYEVQKQNGKYGVKNSGTGKWTIPPKFDFVCKINEELVLVGSGGIKQPYIKQIIENRYATDENGEYIINENYEYVVAGVDTILKNDTVTMQQKVGVMNTNGKVLIPQQYSFIYYDPETQVVRCYKGGKPGRLKGEVFYDAYHAEFEYVEMRRIELEYTAYLTREFVQDVPFDIWYERKCAVKDVDSVIVSSRFPGHFLSIYKKGIPSVYTTHYKPSAFSDLGSIVDVQDIKGQIVFIVRDGNKYRFKNDAGKDLMPFAVDAYHTGYNFLLISKGGYVKRDTIVLGEETVYEPIEHIEKVKGLRYHYYGGTLHVVDSGFKLFPPFDSIVMIERIGGGHWPHSANQYLSGDLIHIYKNKKAGVVNTVEGIIHMPPMYDNVYKGYNGYSWDGENHSRFIAKLNGKWGLVSWTGNKIILPFEYDTIVPYETYLFFLTKNKQVSIFKESMQPSPLFDSIIPLKSEWSSSYYEQSDVSGKFMGYSNGSGSLINKEMKVVCDSLKGWNNFCVGGSKYNIELIKTNGMTGVWNGYENKWISKPFYQFRGPNPWNDVFTVYKLQGKDTLKGLLHCNGGLIGQPEFKTIEFFAEYGLYKAQYGSGKIIFLNSEGKEVIGAERKIASSIIPYLQNAARKKEFQTTWKSFNGPVGADATAFMVDKKGDYWLGTGSSGGVYHSTDKGKTWNARIKGTGPVHVVDMLTVNDSVLMLASYPGERPFYFEKNKYREYDKMYYWSPSGKTWIELDTTNTNRLDSAFYKRWMGYQISYSYEDYNWDNPQPGWTRYYSIFTDSLGHDSFIIKKANGEDSLRITSFIPKDISYKARYPIGQIDKQNLYLLTNSGIYRLNPGKNECIRMGETGLVASDITRIIPKPNATYVVVGQNSIWKHQDGKWKRLVHMTDEDASGTVRTPGFLDERSISVSDNGKVFFNSGTHAYIIKENGEINKLSREFAKGVFMGENTMIMTMATDPEDYYGNDHYIVEYSLSDTTVKKEYQQVGYNRHELLKAGDTCWLLQIEHQNHVTMLNNSFNEISSHTADYLGEQYVTTGARNSVLMKSYDQKALLIWNEKGNGWAEIILDSLHSLSAATITADGKIFYATNYRYEPGGCGGADRYKEKPRLYYVHYNGKKFVSIEIENNINPRIITLQAHETDPNLIYVGTSGSGLYELRFDFK